jgi:ubiquinone/menaquinone biosynthesis C-methylase UbiE
MSEDRFSKQAAVYAQFRPEYPRELFEFIIQHVPSKQLCWDCATGNGQAARTLASYFKKIIATDLSADQIREASLHPKISYHCVSAENANLEPQSVDLIAVAQALHWFNFDIFYSNAKRTLKKNGLLAAWGYDFFSITPELDEILDPYGRVFLKDYWSDKNWLLIGGYKNIPFPFTRIEVPQFYLNVEWNFHQLKGYLDSWSASQKFKDKNHSDPFDEIKLKVESLWGDKLTKKQVSWKLHSLIGING